MNKYSFTNHARSDLKGIGQYTQRKWGKNLRDIYLRKLKQHFSLIANHPLTGQPCDEVYPGLLKFPAEQHIIFYRIINNRVEIARILHNRMDAQKQIGTEQ